MKHAGLGCWSWRWVYGSLQTCPVSPAPVEAAVPAPLPGYGNLAPFPQTEDDSFLIVVVFELWWLIRAGQLWQWKFVGKAQDDTCCLADGLDTILGKLPEAYRPFHEYRKSSGQSFVERELIQLEFKRHEPQSYLQEKQVPADEFAVTPKLKGSASLGAFSYW